MLWISLAVAQVVSLLILLGVIDTGLGDIINQVAAGILQLLTLFGVVNNPTSASSL